MSLLNFIYFLFLLLVRCVPNFIYDAEVEIVLKMTLVCFG